MFNWEKKQKKINNEQGREEEYQVKIDILSSLAKKHQAEELENYEKFNLSPKLVDELEKILAENSPPFETREKIFHRAGQRKSREYADKDILFEAEIDLQDLMAGYKDNRSYIDIYNRKFVDLKIADILNNLFLSEQDQTGGLNSVARINFDMNGLKALNDLGGHQAGNGALSAFTDVLKKGQTTEWLKQEYGLNIVPSIEGGDEFGLLIYDPTGQVNLNQIFSEEKGKKLLTEIEERYLAEISAIKTENLIDFQSDKVQAILVEQDIELPADFKFQITSSAGSITAEEVVQNLKDLNQNSDYNILIQQIVNSIFAQADDIATEHKKEFKNKFLPAKNPTLARLYKINREGN